MFCLFYSDSLWELSPLNVDNNVNGIGKASRNEVFTLKHPDLLKAQQAMVRKIVVELNVELTRIRAGYRLEDRPKNGARGMNGQRAGDPPLVTSRRK